MNILYDLLGELTREEQLFISLALSFLMGATLFIAFLIISRIVKNGREVSERVYRETFQGIINNIILAESTQELESSWQLKDELKKIHASATGKQVLLDQMIVLKKSLSGIAVGNLEYAYKITNLYSFSLGKLNSLNCAKRAQGIFELAEMNYAEAKDKIKPYLQSKNYALRDEAFIALLKSDKERPLSFLDDYQATVSLWMRMRIHHYLSHIDKRQLPDFSNWFSSKNTDVALFSISMARQFRQLSTVPRLVALIRDQDERKANLAIAALGELESYEHTHELIDIIDLYWSDIKLSRRVVIALGKLSSTQAHWESLIRYVNHPDYLVRYKAAHALQQSGNIKLLKDKNLPGGNGLELLIQHVEEPLLQAS